MPSLFHTTYGNANWNNLYVGNNQGTEGSTRTNEAAGTSSEGMTPTFR